jgi:Ca2+-binding EF-hand superfamily protein
LLRGAVDVGQPGYLSDEDDEEGSPLSVSQSTPNLGASQANGKPSGLNRSEGERSRPSWLKNATGGPAFALPNAAQIQRRNEMVEEQLHAIRAKIRASSYFNGVEDWERLFQRADADGNGNVDHEELLKLIAGTVKGSAKGFEVAERDVRALFRHLDIDGDGTISFTEFQRFLEGRINFRISEAEQARLMADLRKARNGRRSNFTKSKELQKIENRRKRHGYANPARPYGWEDVEFTSVPQATRDLANKGTLAERRRRPRPLNPYYDSKYDPAPKNEHWDGSEQPEVFHQRPDGALRRGRPSVRLCARKRRGTPTALPHSLMAGGKGLRQWSKGSMCMSVTRDNRPKAGERRPRPEQYFSPEKNKNFVQQLVRLCAQTIATRHAI